MFYVMIYGLHATYSYLAVYPNYEQYCPLLMTSYNQQLGISINLIIFYYHYSTATISLLFIYWSLRLLICPAKQVGSRRQPCLANIDRSFSTYNMASTIRNLAAYLSSAKGCRRPTLKCKLFKDLRY
jgi:hypothetical protein